MNKSPDANKPCTPPGGRGRNWGRGLLCDGRGLVEEGRVLSTPRVGHTALYGPGTAKPPGLARPGPRAPFPFPSTPRFMACQGQEGAGLIRQQSPRLGAELG